MMNDANSLTLIIPTYNMATFLEPLLASIDLSNVHAQQILVVNDGSTDETSERLRHTKATELKLPGNRGRFWARYLGAQQAQTEWLLFLDSRITLLPGFNAALEQALSRGQATVGWIEIDPRKNIFALYWQRSHEAIFSRHYTIAKTGQALALTTENYDLYLKGTGVFLCRKSMFLKLCKPYENSDLKSDDTLLMKEWVQEEPILIDPQLRVEWEPRTNLRGFLWRLIERGPGFVEYHVVGRRGLFFWLVMLGLLTLSGWIVLFIYQPEFALGLVGAAIPLVALSAFVFTRNLKEWIRIWPLHILVILSFGLGVLWGLAFNVWHWLVRVGGRTEI